MIFLFLILAVFFCEDIVHTKSDFVNDRLDSEEILPLINGTEIKEFNKFYYSSIKGVTGHNFYYIQTKNLPASPEIVNIVLIPLNGDLDLYVSIISGSNYPNHQYCTDDLLNCMTSENYFADVISFNKTNPWLEHRLHIDNKLKISVYKPYNEDWMHYTENGFYIAAIREGEPFELSAGVPVINKMFEAWKFSNYKFFLGSEDDIEYVVNPLVTGRGDPDVLLSSTVLYPDFSTPTNERYLEYSEKFDIVYSPESTHDPKYNFNCNWGASVYALGAVDPDPDCEFIYLTYFQRVKKNYTQIYEGIPLPTQLKDKGWSYFVFHLFPEDIKTGNLNIVVANSQTYGDPDIYVNYPDKPLFPFPSADSCDQAETKIGSDEMVITNPVEGDYKIAIYGYEATKCTITVVKEDALLVNHVDPFSVIIPPQTYVFLKYTNGHDLNNILINAGCSSHDAQCTMANMEMYLSVPNNDVLHQPFPNQKKHDFVGIKSGDQSGVYYYFEKPTKKGNYYFSLFNGETSKTFNISVTVQTNQTHSVLREDVALLNQVAPRSEVNYYVLTEDVLHFANKRVINFVVTPYDGYGDVSLFISTENQFPHDAASSQWMGTNWMDEIITIEADDPKIKNPTFYVGVKGSAWAEFNKYTIVAYEGSPITTLKDAMFPYSDTLHAGKQKFYEYNLESAASIALTLQKQDTGDAIRFYVNGPDKPGFPSVESHEYESSSFITEYLSLDNAKKGTYKITVLCNSISTEENTAIYDLSIASHYRLLDVDSTTIEVTQGVGSKNIEQILFKVEEGVEALSLSMPIIYGEIDDVYVCFNTTDSKTFTCDSTTSDKKVYGWPDISMFMNKASVGAKWCTDCYIRLGVTVKDLQTSYFVSVDAYYGTTFFFGSYLFENTPKSITIPFEKSTTTKSYIKQNFIVDDRWWTGSEADDSWEIQLKVTNGKAGLYVSQDFNVNPDATHNNWKLETSIDGSNTLLLSNKASGSVEALKKGDTFFTIYNIGTEEDGALECVFYAHPLNGNQYMFQDQYHVSDISNANPSYYSSVAVMNPEGSGQTYAPEAFIQIDSCEDFVAPGIYLNVQSEEDTTEVNHQPTPAKCMHHSVSYIESEQIGTVSSRIVVPANTYKHPTEYYLSAYGNNPKGISTARTELFVTSSVNSSKPTLKNPSLSWETKSPFILYIPSASSSKQFGSRPLFYSIYIRKVIQLSTTPSSWIRSLVSPSTSDLPVGVNFETRCALKQKGQRFDYFHEAMRTKVACPHDKNLVCYKVEMYFNDLLRKSDVYKVNVLVEDNYGLGDVYTPIWIVKGTGELNYHIITPNEKSHHGFFYAIEVFISIICWGCLCLTPLGFVIYCISGSLFNFLARKKREFKDIIPNGSFWLNFPMLVWEGILFIVLCGRRSVSFKRKGGRRGEWDQLNDENDYGDQKASELGSTNIDGFDSKPVVDGYGTI